MPIVTVVYLQAGFIYVVVTNCDGLALPLSRRPHRLTYRPSALQSQTAVSTYFTSEQTLHFGFAREHTPALVPALCGRVRGAATFRDQLFIVGCPERGLLITTPTILSRLLARVLIFKPKTQYLLICKVGRNLALENNDRAFWLWKMVVVNPAYICLLPCM